MLWVFTAPQGYAPTKKPSPKKGSYADSLRWRWRNRLKNNISPTLYGGYNKYFILYYSKNVHQQSFGVTENTRHSVLKLVLTGQKRFRGYCKSIWVIIHSIVYIMETRFSEMHVACSIAKNRPSQSIIHFVCQNNFIFFSIIIQ